MRIAIIGGGKRCKAFLEMLDARRFPHLRAQIVAVADPDEQASGMVLAKKKSIYTTRDYRDFYRIPDLDVVIELTGKEELLEDFLKHKPANVRVLEAALSRLFGDMIRFREEFLFRERELEMIESIIDSIFHSIRDGVLIMAPDFKILDANQAFLESMGLNKEDVIGRHCYEITHRSSHPCSQEGLQCPLLDSIESGSTSHAIHEHLDRGQQVRYCEITTVPLRNKKGEVEMVLEILRDITDELEKRVAQKTRALKRDLARLVHEDKMIALGKLVASAVHEINNPLSGIHALARLMCRKVEEGDVGEKSLEKMLYYLRLIDTESARCSSIVQNLLSFSRQQKVESKRFQLNELVERVIHLCKHTMETQHVHLHLDLEGSLPQMVGDPGQIQQCLLNLVFNAIEAMPEGGLITVITQWDRLKDQIRLEVEDTGVGIQSELMSQIFEPFFSTKSQDKGVGLGLSVVYGIIKEHGGSIYVKSEEGEGSRFIVRFPLQSEG
jgi:two-component system, NtrC family, sensor kinase